MSRNLCDINCAVCGGPVRRSGLKYRMTNYDIDCQNAECVACGAKYAAWVSPPRTDIDRHNLLRLGFFDLSYRSTFNDEPGEADLPKGEVKTYYIVTVDGKPTYVSEGG